MAHQTSNRPVRHGIPDVARLPYLLRLPNRVPNWAVLGITSVSPEFPVALEEFLCAVEGGD